MRSATRDLDFESFAVERTPALLRSAWLLCGDRHQAEDLVQETLAKVYLRWSRPLARTIDNPAAYAQTTLTRTFISARRRRSSTEVPIAEVFDGHGRVEPDPAEPSSTRMALLEALSGLAPQDRAVLVLRYLEDLSVEDTAGRLGVSPGAVRTRSSRAVDRLRPLLGSSFAHDRKDTR